MNRLLKVQEVTIQLKELFDQDIHADNREAVIEKLNDLLEQREKDIKQLSPPYTAEENKLGEKLIPLNNEIEKKIQQIYKDLKIEMIQFKKEKKSNRSYSNPYEHVQTNDGMFLDKKK